MLTNFPRVGLKKVILSYVVQRTNPQEAVLFSIFVLAVSSTVSFTVLVQAYEAT